MWPVSASITAFILPPHFLVVHHFPLRSMQPGTDFERNRHHGTVTRVTNGGSPGDPENPVPEADQRSPSRNDSLRCPTNEPEQEKESGHG